MYMYYQYFPCLAWMVFITVKHSYSEVSDMQMWFDRKCNSLPVYPICLQYTLRFGGMKLISL